MYNNNNYYQQSSTPANKYYQSMDYYDNMGHDTKDYYAPRETLTKPQNDYYDLTPPRSEPQYREHFPPSHSYGHSDIPPYSEEYHQEHQPLPPYSSSYSKDIYPPSSLGHEYPPRHQDSIDNRYSYSRGPEQYSRGPEQYSRGPDQYSRGPEQYSRGPEQYSRGPEPYSRGPEPYSRGPEPYSRGPEPDMYLVDRGYSRDQYRGRYGRYERGRERRRYSRERSRSPPRAAPRRRRRSRTPPRRQHRSRINPPKNRWQRPLLSFLVPIKDISRIIGTKGKTIKGFEEKTKTQINVSSKKTTCQSVTIEANEEDNVLNGFEEVYRFYTSLESKIEDCQLLLPLHMISRIVGKGGSRVRAIEDATGCSLQLPRTPHDLSEDNSSGECHIKGSPESQITAIRALIGIAWDIEASENEQFEKVRIKRQVDEEELLTKVKTEEGKDEFGRDIVQKEENELVGSDENKGLIETGDDEDKKEGSGGGEEENEVKEDVKQVEVAEGVKEVEVAEGVKEVDGKEIIIENETEISGTSERESNKSQEESSNEKDIHDSDDIVNKDNVDFIPLSIDDSQLLMQDD